MNISLSDRIEVLAALGHRLNDVDDPKIKALTGRAYIQNPWFTPDNSRKALTAIATSFLNKDNLTQWVKQYSAESAHSKTVALILAGNIPAVGFHDVLCALICGHSVQVKCSSKDDVLIPGIMKLMTEINPEMSRSIEKVEKLQNFDAVIATGGDSAATHFKYYFSTYPHIIRKNRNSVAVLDGNESEADLISLGHDLFDYFGLGCRSVSKLYLPKGFNLDRIFGAILNQAYVIEHNKYKNNYDYNNAIYSMSNESFLTNGFVIFKEDRSLASRIACVHYEYYNDLDELARDLNELSDDIQCISANCHVGGHQTVAIGDCQRPGLADYADGVDTMHFLSNLN